MDSLLNFLGMVIVALIGLIGIIVQTKSHKKIDKQDTLMKSIDKKIDTLRNESKKDDIKLNNKIDSINTNTTKRFLITEMTKIKEGTYIPTDNQRRVIHETKDEYNKSGGDSYVDDMFKDLVNQGLL